MSKPQMTLGEFIRALERQDQDEKVSFDFVHFGPTKFDSYRGYYDQLALGYGGGRHDHAYEHQTVAQLLAHARECVGKEFTGWKGGEYTMHSDTPLWVANPGETGSTAIVNIEKQLYVTIITEKLDH